MANKLRIRRRVSGSPGAPSSLENAELAFNEVDNTLYYGEGTGGVGGTASTILAIGGDGAFVTLSSAQTVTGVKTFSAAPVVPTQSPGDSSTKAASTAYVDAAVTGGSVADGDKGDVVVSGSGSVWTVDTGVITNAKLATVGANTLKGNNTGSTAAPTDLSVTNVKTMLSLNNVDNTSDVNKPVSTAQAAADALAIPLTQKGANSGVATLDSGGKIPSTQIPAIAITDTFVVASQAAMLALTTADVGDVAVRTDLNQTFILTAAPYSTLANWQVMLTPTDAVTSVFGRTGVVSATSGDYTVAQVTGAAPLASPALTGTPTAPTAATATNTTQIATTAFVKAQGYSTTVGTVTSVTFSGGTTGLTVTGSPITSSGTITLAGTLAIANGGTGQTTATAAFDALNPTTTLGDLSYRGASASARLAGNTTTAKQYLSQTGTGSVSAIPAWAAISTADLSGTISNAQLANSTITVGTTAISLGASSTTLAGLTSVTSTSFVGALTGNASTATSAATLTTSRTIGMSGVTATATGFNGSANITIPVTAVPATLITGQVAVANGGTGSSTAAGARTNLGLGTMSTQDASAVAITGGTIDGITLDGGTF